MNKTLANTMALPSKPTRLSAEDREVIATIRDAVCSDGQASFSISKAKVPSGSILMMLQDRSRDLSRWLSPAADFQAVKEPINFMLGTMKLKDAEEGDAALIAKAYHVAMSDLPLWAVKEACLAALRGAIGDGTGRWAPQPGELHKTAERIMAVYQRELADINRILVAKPREPIATTREERAAIVAKVRRMIRQVANASEIEGA